MSSFCLFKKKILSGKLSPLINISLFFILQKLGFFGGQWGGAGGVNNLIFSLKSTYNPFKKLLLG